MQLREALKIANSVDLSSGNLISVISSFEPLHFPTFLQAEIAKHFPMSTPSVKTFGFDQLEHGLRETENAALLDPAILLLEWADLHPALSWKTRSIVQRPSQHELDKKSEMVVQRIGNWLERRPRNQSVLVLPPDSWFPIIDPVLPSTAGGSFIEAQKRIWGIASMAISRGTRVLKATGELDIRSISLAGCPMDIHDAGRLASQCVELLFPNPRRKVLVVDLDNTLWKGVLAEDGLQGISCDDSGAGYPYFLFQKFILKLRSEGILIAYCSKNELQDVQNALTSKVVLLAKEDFDAGECSWRSKSLGIEGIADELGLGLDSFVFVDDNLVEIAEVSGRLPEVICLQTPSQVNEWPQFLMQLQAFFWTSNVSEEDTIRTSSNETIRRQHLDSHGSVSGGYTHLRSFELRISVRSRVAAESRTSELLNKTNQFNLTGERVKALDLLTWAEHPDFFCYSVALEDRYGPYGVVGILYGWVRDAKQAEVSNMVLSCRALGRGVEYLALKAISVSLGCHSVSLKYCRTARNEPALVFLKSVSLESKADGSIDGGKFILDSDKLLDRSREVLEETGAVVHVV